MWSTDWIELAQDWERWRELVNAVMNLWIPYNAGNFLTGWKPVSFSRTLLLGISSYLRISLTWRQLHMTWQNERQWICAKTATNQDPRPHDLLTSCVLCQIDNGRYKQLYPCEVFSSETAQLRRWIRWSRIRCSVRLCNTINATDLGTQSVATHHALRRPLQSTQRPAVSIKRRYADMLTFGHSVEKHRLSLAQHR